MHLVTNGWGIDGNRNSDDCNGFRNDEAYNGNSMRIALRVILSMSRMIKMDSCLQILMKMQMRMTRGKSSKELRENESESSRNKMKVVGRLAQTEVLKDIQGQVRLVWEAMTMFERWDKIRYT